MVRSAVVRDMRLDRASTSVIRPNSQTNAVAEAAATWVVGGLALIGALVLGSVLALVFAATVVVAMVLTFLMMVAAVLTQRSRRMKPLRVGAITARKVGHSWVAYGWDKDA